MHDPRPSSGPPAMAWGCGALIVATVLAVFHGAAHGTFLVWDDDINITSNPHLRALSWENLKWMFSDVGYMRRYVPLAWLDWAIEHRLTGLTATSAHVGNIGFHAVNSILVFLLVRVLVSVARPAESAGWKLNLGAFVGALAWAVHPLRVEVVAWASGRIYCQAICFLLMATLAYVEAARGVKRRAWLAVSLIAFAASLLTYPLGLGFVAVLVVLDTCLFRRLRFEIAAWRDPGQRAVWFEKIPFAVVTLAVVAIALGASFHAKGVWEPPPTLAELGVFPRVMRAFYLWGYYVWKPLVPTALAPVYTMLVWFDALEWKFIVSAIGVVGITGVLVWKRHEHPLMLALWLCHLILLVPMLGLTEQPHYPSDRYSYLAGLVGAVAVGGLWLHVGGRCAAVISLGVLAVFAVLSAAQIRIWHDSEGLFRYLLLHVGESRYRADIAMRLGEVLRNANRLAEAEPYYRESLQFEPRVRRSAVPHFGLAKVAEAAGRPNDAAVHYQEALKLQPDFAQAYLGFGELLVRVGQPADAAAMLRSAIGIEPDNAAAHHLLGVAYLDSGQAADAVTELHAAVRLEPAAIEARCSLVAALTAAGRIAEAVQECQAALRLKPHSAEAYAALGAAYRAGGDGPKAIAALREAVRLKPGFPDAQNSLGMVLTQAGRVEEAVGAFAAATRASPRFVLAHFNLGLALRDTGRRREAIDAFSAVLKLSPEFGPARDALAELQGK